MADKNMFQVSDASFEQEVLKSEVPVLVDFWAEWCGPCRMLAPTVEAIAQEYNGKLKVAKLNVDETAGVSQRYGIRGIPTLLLFKDGEVRDQLVGNYPRDHIEQMLDKHVAKHVA
ncbi:MAG: thioredoxin [Terriglobia bacterium]